MIAKEKEKAKELVESYRGLAHSDFHNQTGYDESQREENQRQCAIIAVDEIIKETDTYYDTLIASERKLYWRQVKTEIENL